MRGARYVRSIVQKVAWGHGMGAGKTHTGGMSQPEPAGGWTEGKTMRLVRRASMREACVCNMWFQKQALMRKPSCR